MCSETSPPFVTTRRNSRDAVGTGYQPPSSGNTIHRFAVTLSAPKRRSFLPDFDRASTVSEFALSGDTMMRYLAPTGSASPLRCWVIAPAACGSVASALTDVLAFAPYELKSSISAKMPALEVRPQTRLLSPG